MSKNLRPSAPAVVTQIAPTFDGSGNIVSYTAHVSVNYIDDDGNPVTVVPEIFDGWPLLSSTQQGQLQAIHDAMLADINTEYFS